MGCSLSVPRDSRRWTDQSAPVPVSSAHACQPGQSSAWIVPRAVIPAVSALLLPIPHLSLSGKSGVGARWSWRHRRNMLETRPSGRLWPAMRKIWPERDEISFPQRMQINFVEQRFEFWIADWKKPDAKCSNKRRQFNQILILMHRKRKLRRANQSINLRIQQLHLDMSQSTNQANCQLR